MTRFYKQVRRLIPVFSLMVLLFVMLSLSAQAQDDALFTVEGVQVDVTDEDAVKAREKAFAQAEAQAFEILYERLSSSNQAILPTIPEAPMLSTLVQDFEITDEKISAVRYVGTYTFRFKGDAVRNYLTGSGVSYTDVSSKPVLILPFYQWGTRSVLWGDTNPWRKSWADHRTGRGVVPVVLPIGDLEDMAAISGDTMLTYDAAALDEMAGRYGARGAIIVLAIPERPSMATEMTGGKLSVMIYSTDRGRPRFVRTVLVTVPPGQDVYAQAVADVQAALQQDWKSRTQISAQEQTTNMLRAQVAFSSMKEWIETQKALEKVQGTTEVKLLSLKPGGALVELFYRGTEERLRLALAQEDITLALPMPTYDPATGGMTGTAGMHTLYLNKYHSQRPYKAQSYREGQP